MLATSHGNKGDCYGNGAWCVFAASGGGTKVDKCTLCGLVSNLTKAGKCIVCLSDELETQGYATCSCEKSVALWNKEMARRGQQMKQMAMDCGTSDDVFSV